MSKPIFVINTLSKMDTSFTLIFPNLIFFPILKILSYPKHFSQCDLLKNSSVVHLKNLIRTTNNTGQ